MPQRCINTAYGDFACESDSSDKVYGVYISQDGKALWAKMSQSGVGNVATITQTGHNLNAQVTQIGSYNTASVTQRN